MPKGDERYKLCETLIVKYPDLKDHCTYKGRLNKCKNKSILKIIKDKKDKKKFKKIYGIKNLNKFKGISRTKVNMETNTNNLNEGNNDSESHEEIDELTLSEEQLKKIFTKSLAEDCLKEFKLEKFGLKTQRSRIKKYLGENIWSDLSTIPIKDITKYVRDYSISEKSKYSYIHNDIEYVKETIKKTKVSKENSPCKTPQQFSESVVKPSARKYIGNKLNIPIKEYVEQELLEKLTLHTMERINQQLKADYSEYIILMSCENIIPTLKHTKGTDMYFINYADNLIEDLDIKTTRSIWDIEPPEEAIKALYEKQGEDLFSSNPRLYIYLSDNENIDSNQILEQLNKKYDINFTFKGVEYNVSGTRLIIV